MNKTQVLILLLIIALAFYYLNENNSPKSPSSLVKKSQPPKSTSINLPSTKIEELLNQGWPAHFPSQNEPKNNQATEPKSTIKFPSNESIVYFPSAQWVEEPSPQWDEPIKKSPEPSQFKGLNPPHSQVDEPFEPPKPPTEPKPIKATLNCPAAEFIPDTNQATEPSSELTSEEQTQRKTQELSDYNWLLKNKTIDYWHYEQKLTSSQYHALLLLVNQDEMNTLNYFLNLLPVNYEWLLISSEFKNPTLAEKWISHHFTYHQTQDWLKIGLKPTDHALAAWLKNTKHLTPEQTLNFADWEKLKEEFSHYAS